MAKELSASLRAQRSSPVINKIINGWIATTTSCLAMTIAILLFSNNPVQAESATSDLVLKVGEVISLSISSPCDSASYTGNDVTISLTPKSTGTFSSCPNIVTVGTNTTGFQLLFKSSGTNLVNTITSSYTIPSTTNTTPNKLVVNTWGYAIPAAADTNHDVIGIPSAILSVFDSNYATRTDSNPIPADKYAKAPITDAIIKQVDNTITSPTLQNNQTTVYYAAATDLTTRSGMYKTAITYTAIGEEIPDPPAPTPPPNMATKTTRIVPNFASTATPSGNGTGTNGPQFSFYGSGFGANPVVTIDGKPCTDVVVNSAGTAMTCTGPVADMTDGEKRTFINGADAGNDYTVWYSSYSFPTLQSLTSATCDATPTIYRDARDSQLYFVAKLLDNKCWMLDNLKYKPNGDSTGTVTANFSATQVADTGASLDYDVPNFIDPIAQPAYCYNSPNMSTYHITKCGLLYNFFTATAGVDKTTTTGEATSSICPTHWRLPSGYNASGDFGALDVKYGGTGEGYQSGNPVQISTLWSRLGAFFIVFSGSYGGGSSFSGQGNIAWFWSSSMRSTTYSAYTLRIGSSFVSAGTDNYYRFYGLALRCVIGP
jgi:uncharacterized protein (TIGR02145 family)